MAVGLLLVLLNFFSSGQHGTWLFRGASAEANSAAILSATNAPPVFTPPASSYNIPLNKKFSHYVTATDADAEPLKVLRQSNRAGINHSQRFV